MMHNKVKKEYIMVKSKLILLFLCLPIFSFSQEWKKLDVKDDNGSLTGEKKWVYKVNGKFKDYDEPDFVKERNHKLANAYKNLVITVDRIQGFLEDEYLRGRIESDMTKKKRD